MSARKSVYAIRDHQCDGGQSPNAYVPKITAEVRLHFPPNTVEIDQVRKALDEAWVDAELKLMEFFGVEL